MNLNNIEIHVKIVYSTIPAVTYNQDRMVRVKSYMIQFCFFTGNNWLSTDWMVFVYMKIKYMNLPVTSHCGKYGARIWCPSHIPDLRIQVKHEQRFAVENKDKNKTIANFQLLNLNR